jgi:hypothetical protein
MPALNDYLGTEREKKMDRKLGIFTIALAACAIAAPAAQAGPHKVDPRLRVVSIGVGAASTAGYFALNDWHWKWDSGHASITQLGAMTLTTIGCAALSPIVATAVLNRPLTQREAGVLVGSCVVPIIGGWLVNAAYDAHPEWDPAYRPAQISYKNKRHRKKR